MYYDLHTHHFPEENKNICSMVNVSVEFFSLPREERLRQYRAPYPLLEETKRNIMYSIGIHPWHIQRENIQKELNLLEKYVGLPNVKAIGECGLDKLCETDFNRQKEVFLLQTAISEKVGKPLIIHCVKSFDEIIYLKKKVQPSE